jgi:hypothetical protein
VCLQGYAYIYDIRADQLPKDIPLYGFGFPFAALTDDQLQHWHERVEESTPVPSEKAIIKQGTSCCLE